jgi:hypothetical protein
MSFMNHNKANSTPEAASNGIPKGDGQLPIPRYDRLGDKEVTSQLSGLSQVELATVEEYELANGNRHVVLEKLRYLRTSEPLPNYDALESAQVIEALQGADGQTLRAVRDYERKFQRRQSVSDAIAAMLPTSQLSESERQAQAEKDERVRSRPEPGEGV